MNEPPGGGVEWLPAYSPGPPRHSPLGPLPRFVFEDVPGLINSRLENNNKNAELTENNKVKHPKPAYRYLFYMKNLDSKSNFHIWIALRLSMWSPFLLLHNM